MKKSAASTASHIRSLLHSYRTLLRSSYPAAGFSRPATKNTRRYLRDEIVDEIRIARSPRPLSEETGQQVRDQRQHRLKKLLDTTLAFHLSSSLRPADRPDIPHVGSQNGDPSDERSPKKDHKASSSARSGRSLAGKVIANLSSLTYHHLSPHTQMQSLAHRRMTRSIRKAGNVSSIARMLGKMGSDLDPDSLEAGAGSEVDSIVNATHQRIPFLQPSSKPPRGPLSSRLAKWDGQNPSKVVSPGNIANMERDLETIQKLLQQAVSPSQSAKLRTEADQLRQRIKSGKKAELKAAEQVKLEAIPINAIAELVATAQESEDIWLGKQRWKVRQSNGFLRP